MKKLLFLAFCAGLVYGGYKLMDLVTQGGKGPMNPAVQAQKGAEVIGTVRRAAGKEAAAAVQTTVNAFQAAEGRWPSSLEELVEKKYMDSVPAGISYDPATGKVSAG